MLIWTVNIQLENALEHFHCCCNAGVVRSHPCGKDKYAARMGHPELTLTLKML